jgi:hypothetical protein
LLFLGARHRSKCGGRRKNGNHSETHSPGKCHRITMSQGIDAAI